MRVLLTAVLMCVVAGCPEPGGLTLDPPDWADSEIAQYRIVVGGDTVGDHIIQVYRTEFEGEPALNLVVETMTGEAGIETDHDSSWVMVRLPDLRPLRSARTIVKPEMLVSVELVYSGDSVRATELTPGGPQHIDLPVGPLDFDFEQMTTLVRALALAPGRPLELGAVIGVVGMKVPVELELVGRETVTVPSGTFDCRRVRFTVGDQEVHFWHEADGLRRLVRYAVPASDLKMELIASIVNRDEGE